MAAILISGKLLILESQSVSAMSLCLIYDTLDRKSVFAKNGQEINNSRPLSAHQRNFKCIVINSCTCCAIMHIYRFILDTLANSGDPDEMLHSVAVHQVRHLGRHLHIGINPPTFSIKIYGYNEATKVALS